MDLSTYHKVHIEDEQWKEVVGWETLYQVSDHGRVRNTHTGRILKLYTRSEANDRVIVSLNAHPRRKTLTVARMVYEAFNLNGLRKLTLLERITQKDGDPTWNAPDNLEMVVQEETPTVENFDKITEFVEKAAQKGIDLGEAASQLDISVKTLSTVLGRIFWERLCRCYGNETSAWKSDSKQLRLLKRKGLL